MTDHVSNLKSNAMEWDYSQCMKRAKWAADAAVEIERLTRWKAEALAVFAEWDEVVAMVPERTEDIGRRRAEVVADRIKSLEARNAGLTAALAVHEMWQ